MITLIARFTAIEGSREVVRSLIADYGEHVRSAEGTLAFSSFTSRETPNEVVVFEQYQDQAAFDGHLADPANADFNRRLVPLIEGDGSVLEFLEPTS